MKVTIAICDDDINCADLIENYISEFKNVDADCDVYSSGEELIQAYSANAERYEVVFLDMEMEQLTGIETAKHIRELDEHVIIVFITSHTEYMYESFKCTPFRFLIKPLDKAEFTAAFNDICKKLSVHRKMLAFTENKARIRLYCDDIIYCESQNHCVSIHTKEKVYKLCRPLSELQEQLDKDLFCRVHKSYIINFHYVKSIIENDIILYHINDPIPIGRSYKKNVLIEYTKFIERDFCV